MVGGEPIRGHRAARGVSVLLAGIFATACALYQDRGYQDETGNHERPHPHIPDVGKSTPESTEEPIRVRDDKERARMERYIADHVSRDDVVSTIELSAHELIDCVALDRQPALRRPELKGHEVRLQPPTGPKEKPQKPSTTLVGGLLRRASCPPVPPQRAYKRSRGRESPLLRWRAPWAGGTVSASSRLNMVN